MDAKIKVLADMLSVIGLSEEERASLIRQLLERWKIPAAALFPAEKTSGGEAQVEERDAETQMSAVRKQRKRTAVKVPKAPRYSKNGKRLGRPPKNPQVQPEAAEAVGPVAADTKGVSGAQEVKTEAAVSAVTDTKGVSGTQAVKTEADDRQETVSGTAVDKQDAVTRGQNAAAAPAFDNVTHLIDAEEIEETQDLKIGKRYDFAIIYKWASRLYIKSHYILSGLYPEGVCINYEGHLRQEYTQFAISLADEVPGVTLRQAKAYAANQLPRFEGERWNIMDVIQQSAAKKVAPDLNKLLKKLSGDLFRGKYATGDSFETLMPEIKIRYAINIK